MAISKALIASLLISLLVLQLVQADVVRLFHHKLIILNIILMFSKTYFSHVTTIFLQENSQKKNGYAKKIGNYMIFIKPNVKFRVRLIICVFLSCIYRLWECVCSTVQAFEEAEAVSQSVRDLLLQVQLCASGYVRKLRQVPVLR
jgi:dolichyl-phosphate-mannose--protein O-mannosyl transferase